MAALGRTGVGSLLLLAVALVLAVVLGFVLAFGSSEPDPWEERWAELGVEEAEFVFLGDLTSSEQQSIRRELRIAQVVLAEHFGAVSSDFTAYVSTDLDALNEHYASHVGQGTVTALTCGGTAREGAIFLILETCHEKHRRSGGPLAHEYFHVLQYEAGLVVTADRKLWWLVEGSAEYASGLVGEAQGRRTLDTLRQGKELSWSAGLAEGARYWYDYGFLATDRLLQRASPEAILEFFRLGGDETAFESVFGMPWLVFWSSTDAYLRVAVRPFEWRVGGTVLGADGLPMEGVAVYALVRIGGEAWNAGGGGTGPEGAFEFTAPGSGYTLGFWMQCPRDDDIGGRWVYMGEWGEASVVADLDGILSPDDRRAKPFDDGERDRTGLVIEIPETRESLIARHCEE